VSAHQFWNAQATDPAGVAMSCFREYALKLESTDENRKAVEPPMNTDEHRLKADKEKQDKNKIAFVYIKSSSVFIGVHRCSSVVKNSFF
jgi:hypothetical protein